MDKEIITCGKILGFQINLQETSESFIIFRFPVYIEGHKFFINGKTSNDKQQKIYLKYNSEDTDLSIIKSGTNIYYVIRLN
jgi:hypothetical protein